ncbi:alpha-galactosidase [Dactylosporangium siamense]|uniref:Alpha-galactosidase n=1 Tax=Dactylosporangium siamense TaxID=685454 RepID=A0A919PIZ7_9ACTN|nr:alpha-galactosidase [Dactylosporangium siamense]GIG45022.1 alpha-galactosidase [Dactylosporangium siamense]
MPNDPLFWALHTLRSSYVIHLGGEDVPLLAHWGRSVSDDTAAELVAAAVQGGHRRGWESVLDGREEYPSGSGLRFVEPALAVGGTVRWQFTAAEHTGGALDLRFTELTTPLRLTLHYRWSATHDVIERWASIANDGAEPVTLHRAGSAAWCLPARPGYRLSTVHGRWAAETRLQQAPIPAGQTVIGSRHTTTGPFHNPWFAIDDGAATETAGEVWTAALAWSGTWQATVQHLANGRVTATVDAGPAVLGPGEEHVTPKTLGTWTDQGFGAASRGWHTFVRDTVLPTDETRPVLYNSWEATGFDVDEANQIGLAERAAALGCELFVMDDGWFGKRISDHAGLGDWTPNPDRFPAGLDPLIHRVHELGMRFGIWVEPEMVNPDSDLYRAHPDWVYHTPGYPRHELRQQLVLNLGRPEVATWLHGWMDALLAAHDIAFVKWDMNRPVTDPGADPQWARRHATALYDIFDRLRRDHPHVRFESCASGGGRVDLGILARTDQVWPSDNTDASDRLHIQEGFSQLYPARTMTAWVTDAPNFLTGRQLPLRFRFHVAMAGVLAVGGDLNAWTDAERDEAATLIAQYKRIRHVVQHGDLHRLRSPRTSTAPALAYATADEVVVFQWLDGHRFGEPALPVALPFLPPDGTWTDTDRGTIHSGSFLAVHGVDHGLRRDHDSAVTHLRRTA